MGDMIVLEKIEPPLIEPVAACGLWEDDESGGMEWQYLSLPVSRSIVWSASGIGNMSYLGNNNPYRRDNLDDKVQIQGLLGLRADWEKP